MRIFRIIDNDLRLIRHEVKGIGIDLLDGEEREKADQIAEKLTNIREELQDLHESIKGEQ